MTYAICDSQLEVHYFAHLVMAPDVYVVPCDMCGILGPMVMQFRNLRGVRLLGSMGHLDHDDQWSLLSWWLVQWRANSEPRILNLFCMLVTWMPIKGVLKTCCNFVPGDKSTVIYFVTDSHPFFAFATSRYTLSWRLRRVINRFKSPCKSTMVSFDLENFEKFWENGHPIASSIKTHVSVLGGPHGLLRLVLDGCFANLGPVAWLKIPWRGAGGPVVNLWVKFP